MEEQLNSEVSPYLFNGKERDQETGFYYYGARYYDPKISLWLGVDPLANYDPINETEYYFDGQHNGGAFNNGNLNPYIYCYQSPIIWTDPNGKQNLIRYITYNKAGQITSIHDNYMKLERQDHPEYAYRNPGIKYVHDYAPTEKYPNGRILTETLMNGVMPADYGFYSGAGCATLYGAGSVYDFSIQPIDIADSIAKVHDWDYVTNRYDSNIGVVNDTNTLQADIDMVKRVELALAGAKSQDAKMKLGYIGGEGIEKPRWEGLYASTLLALKGQLEVISLMREFKQWKLDNGYSRTDSILNNDIYEKYKESVGKVQAFKTYKLAQTTQ